MAKLKTSADKPAISDRAMLSFAKAIERAYANWGLLIARSFVGGMFTALGATLGLVVVLYVLSAIFSWLDWLPGIGEFFANLNRLVSAALPKL